MVHPETGKSQEDSRDKKLDPYVKTRSRVLRAGFGQEFVRILAERLTQSELVPRLSIVCHNPTYANA